MFDNVSFWTNIMTEFQNSSTMFSRHVDKALNVLLKWRYIQSMLSTDVINEKSMGAAYIPVHTNKNKKMSSFNSTENIHKKEDGSYYVVWLTKPHQWLCNDPATKARRNILQFREFQIDSRLKEA